MRESLTAGAKSLIARADETRYDPYEIGEALCNDITGEVWKCIDAHHKIIDEPEFCVVVVIATDCLIKGVKRRKFYAWPYLPKPRPNQMCFLYRKRDDNIQLLWTLPAPHVMASVSVMNYVAPVWRRTKRWSDSFYKGTFWETIRTESGIDLLSEEEYLGAHREELIQAGCKEIDSSFTETFDFSKITVNKVVNSQAAFPHQCSLDDFRETKALDGDIGPKII